MCTHTTTHAQPCNCVISRKTTPCLDAKVFPIAFPVAGPGYQGSACPAFAYVKVILDENETKCVKHIEAKTVKMGGTRTPERKGSGDERMGGVGEAGLDFEFGFVSMRGGGSPQMKVDRMASVAKRVKVGKVKEMVMKFNAVVEQEETVGKVSGESVKKVSGMGGQEETVSKKGVMVGQDEMDKIDEENESEELVDQSDEIGSQVGTDKETKKTTGQEVVIKVDEKSEAEELVNEIVEMHGEDNTEPKIDCQARTVQELDETTGQAGTTMKVEETHGQETITTKVDVRPEQVTASDVNKFSAPEENASKVDETAAQPLTDNEFDGFDESFYADDNTLEEASTPDQDNLDEFPAQGTRISTLVRQYSDLVSPISDLDDPQESTQEPSISILSRQCSDLISPLTEFDADSSSTASSRPQTPITPSLQHLAHLDSPSTTPLLQRARTNESTTSYLSAASYFSSNYDNNSDDERDEMLRTFSCFSSSSDSDPFYLGPSTTTSTSTSNHSTFTPQISFDSFVDSFDNSFSDTFGDSPNSVTKEGIGEWEWEEPELGTTSLQYAPMDGSVWNWNGSRWVGQRADGTLLS